jgi:hypothetical protein
VSHGFASLLATLAVVLAAAPSDPPVAPATPSASPESVLLYDTLVDVSVVADAAATGARPLLLVYQYTSPDSAKTGDIDVLKVLDAIDHMTGGEPPAWGMLDFEYAFTDRLQKGPEDPGAVHATAEMLKLLRAVKSTYPRTKWTFYGVPFVPYWLQNESWDDADDNVKRVTLTNASRTYGPIIDQCDWVSPSVYPVYDPAAYPESRQGSVRRAGIAWRRAQVGLARLLAKGKPVIPMVSPVWQPNGNAPAGMPVPSEQFVQDQVAPVMRGGAAGVAIWTSYDRIIKAACATREATSPEEFPRENLCKAFLDGRMPIDWQAPGVAEQLRSRAAVVVLKALRDVRAWQADQASSPTPNGP